MEDDFVGYLWDDTNLDNLCVADCIGDDFLQWAQRCYDDTRRDEGFDDLYF